MTARREIDAFLESLADVPPNAVTACAGWTAHELVAHLVSGVEAIASQAEAHGEGREIPVFGSFAEREFAFWDVDDAVLRHRLEDGERRMTDGLHAVRASGGDTPIPGIGWGMAIDDVELHLRQEFAVHRWDLVGDDDEGDELLARPELLDHSVRLLAEPLLAAGRARDPSPDQPFTARIRAAGERDLLIDVCETRSCLRLVEAEGGEADVECDPAARLLILLGAPTNRCSTSAHTARSDGSGSPPHTPFRILNVLGARQRHNRRTRIGGLDHSMSVPARAWRRRLTSVVGSIYNEPKVQSPNRQFRVLGVQ